MLYGLPFFFERTTENVNGLYITHYCCYVSGEIVAGDFDKETKLMSCPLRECK